MIAPAYARAMARYNAEIDRRCYAAAAGLAEADRRADLGLFWHSIMGTFNHLLWADRMWMHRLAGWDKPAVNLAESDRLVEDFAALSEARAAADAAMIAWADALDDASLAGDLTWFSGAAGRDMTRPRALLIAHMFNHQTHHRGQVHAGLTRLGADPGIMDLPFLD